MAESDEEARAGEHKDGCRGDGGTFERISTNGERIICNADCTLRP